MSEAVATRRTPLEILVDAIDAKVGMRAQLEAEIVRQREAEASAVAAFAESPGGTSPYSAVGGGAFKAQQAQEKASVAIKNIDTEVAAMLQRKEKLVGDQSKERLDEAIRYVRPLADEMTAALKEAGELLANLVRDPWQRYRTAVDEFSMIAARGNGIAAEASAVDPDAAAKWRQATSLPFPVATNFGHFVSQLLLTAIDRDGRVSTTNQMLAELVPDLAGEPLYATVGGDVTRFSASATVGQHLDAGLKHALDPYVAPPVVVNEEDARQHAENEAERVRILDLQFARAGGPKTMVSTPQAVAWRPEPPPPGTQNRGELDEPITEAELAAIARADLMDGD